MARTSVSKILRPQKQIVHNNIKPTLRRGPGPLSKDTLLIQKPRGRGVSLPKENIREATPVGFGQHIYVYNNIHTNQVVYSLTRHLNNKKSLAQIPFLGKKTVPAKLRKDMWLPLYLASFPTPFAGLEAYRKLREYRHLHETAYDLDTITEKYGERRGQLLPTKKRGKVLMNQKANSIADLAAVLLQQERGPSAMRLERAERRLKRVEGLRRVKGEGKVKQNPVDLGKELGGVEGVLVRWAHLEDAGFAEAWPAGVEHDILERSRYTIAFPVLEEGGGGGEARAP